MAAVNVDGIEGNCELTASATPPTCCPPTLELMDEYGNISVEKEKTRLDRFAERLNQDVNAKGYLIVYNQNRARAESSRKYLIEAHQIAKDQLVILEGRTGQKMMLQLYYVPLCAVPPVPFADPPNQSLQRCGNS